MTDFDYDLTMHGVYLTGHGGFEKLEYRDDISIPKPNADDVLIKVGAAGINNTDINTRTAWYSKVVREGTSEGAISGFDQIDDKGGWAGALNFPIIQGADCCGEIVAVGADINPERIGERVLVRTMQAETRDNSNFTCITSGSERNGAFAQYMAAESIHALAINSSWTDVELASVPCAYSTAEGMISRANVANETVLVTGASGGVGSAAVQLSKRRGATVIAVSSAAKAQEVKSLGADRVIDRDSDLLELLGEESVDVIVDVVAGKMWPSFLDILKRGGRNATSGAIAGPIVELDLRTLYLKDLSFYGSTYQGDEIFSNLLGYIERNEVRPMVAKSYMLSDIIKAQEDFISKQYAGKLVLVP